MKIKDVFGDLALNEPVKVELEGRELELDIRAPDLHPLMMMGEGQVSENNMEQMTDTLRGILRRSFLPHYDGSGDKVPQNLTEAQQEENDEADQWIEGLLVRYYFPLFLEIAKGLNWQDEADIEQQIQQAQNQSGKSPM